MDHQKVFVVNANWDDEAKVWVATSDDVPGLATEADEIPVLVNKLKVMIPELLDLNGCAHGDEVRFTLRGELNAIAYRHAA